MAPWTFNSGSFTSRTPQRRRHMSTISIPQLLRLCDAATPSIAAVDGLEPLAMVTARDMLGPDVVRRLCSALRDIVAEDDLGFASDIIARHGLSLEKDEERKGI